MSSNEKTLLTLQAANNSLNQNIASVKKLAGLKTPAIQEWCEWIGKDKLDSIKVWEAIFKQDIKQHELILKYYFDYMIEHSLLKPSSDTDAEVKFKRLLFDCFTQTKDGHRKPLLDLSKPNTYHLLTEHIQYTLAPLEIITSTLLKISTTSSKTYDISKLLSLDNRKIDASSLSNYLEMFYTSVSRKKLSATINERFKNVVDCVYELKLPAALIHAENFFEPYTFPLKLKKQISANFTTDPSLLESAIRNFESSHQNLKITDKFSKNTLHHTLSCYLFGERNWIAQTLSLIVLTKTLRAYTSGNSEISFNPVIYSDLITLKDHAAKHPGLSLIQSTTEDAIKKYRGHFNGKLLEIFISLLDQENKDKQKPSDSIRERRDKLVQKQNKLNDASLEVFILYRAKSSGVAPEKKNKIGLNNIFSKMKKVIADVNKSNDENIAEKDWNNTGFFVPFGDKTSNLNPENWLTHLDSIPQIKDVSFCIKKTLSANDKFLPGRTIAFIEQLDGGKAIFLFADLKPTNQHERDIVNEVILGSDTSKSPEIDRIEIDSLTGKGRTTIGFAFAHRGKTWQAAFDKSLEILGIK